MINWHEELIKLGFVPMVLNSSLRYYGYYKDGKYIFSGTVEYERKGKILDADFDLKHISGKTVQRYYPDDAGQVFCPFIRTDNDKRPNDKPVIVHRSIEDVEKYINASVAELVDALDSKPSGVNP